MDLQCLGIGMLFMPFSPRWLMEQSREEEALQTLSRLRRKPADEHSVRFEFLEIMAEVRYAREASKAAYPDAGSFRLLINNYWIFFSSWPKFKRLAVGGLTMFFQQFMVRLQKYIDFPEYVLRRSLLGVQRKSLIRPLKLSSVADFSPGCHILRTYESVSQRSQLLSSQD